MTADASSLPSIPIPFFITQYSLSYFIHIFTLHDIDSLVSTPTDTVTPPFLSSAHPAQPHTTLQRMLVREIGMEATAELLRD